MTTQSYHVDATSVSLARAVAWTTGGVIAGAMLVYALYQYFTLPGVTLAELLISHGWHVLALAALTWGALEYVLHHKVVQPTRDLYVKLYAVTRGDYRPIHVRTNIREIRDIAESVDLLLKHKLQAYDVYHGKEKLYAITDAASE